MNPSEDELLEQSFRPGIAKAKTSLTPRKEILRQILSELPEQSVTFSQAERPSYQEAKISFLSAIHMNFRKFAPQYAIALVAIIAIAGIIRTTVSDPGDTPAIVGQAPAQDPRQAPMPREGGSGSPETGTSPHAASIDTLLADLGQESDPSLEDEDLAAEADDETSNELIISLSETYDEETF